MAFMPEAAGRCLAIAGIWSGPAGRQQQQSRAEFCIEVSELFLVFCQCLFSQNTLLQEQQLQRLASTKVTLLAEVFARDAAPFGLQPRAWLQTSGVLPSQQRGFQLDYDWEGCKYSKYSMTAHIERT